MDTGILEKITHWYFLVPIGFLFIQMKILRILIPLWINCCGIKQNWNRVICG